MCAHLVECEAAETYWNNLHNTVCSNTFTTSLSIRCRHGSAPGPGCWGRCETKTSPVYLYPRRRRWRPSGGWHRYTWRHQQYTPAAVSNRHPQRSRH
ncbi:unnamed protein product [Leptidea sinapis]|uniref:Uncharacterized protein n=1 Tax=Leptidea sinapis TaxID=189913 RepID=A0A5E4PN70_9NEOP|nr:unnamed protein product [Leptidea sinapis]